MQHVVTIEKLGTDFEDNRSIVLTGVSKGRNRALTLQIRTPDQDATEFLTRKKFEELVTNARLIMGWA